MRKIKIKNIGPIIDVELNLNKVNVIMGPQSSGKSTIAKLISYCQWAEKRFILDGKFEYDFTEMFIRFHKVSEAYFSKESFFHYESEFLSIKQKGLNFSVKVTPKKKKPPYKKSKNIYIPAERNFVSVIPNLGKYNESNDNIMNFLYDWHDAKRSFTSSNLLSVLNLGVSYHYIKDSESDMLTIGKKKELHLKDASSGLQSVIPLVMLINYLTAGFYKQDKPLSINERDSMDDLLEKFTIALQNPKLVSIVAEIEGTGGKTVEIPRAIAEELSKIMLYQKNYHFTNFIIEEPEQNLFPATQRDLVYYLFDQILNTHRPHSLLITTHSPFILYAINNCIMGKRVSKDMPEEEQHELKSHNSWIDSSLISVWQMQDGVIKSVLDERTGTVTKHYFNEVMNEVLEEYYEMLSYFKNDNTPSK